MKRSWIGTIIGSLSVVMLSAGVRAQAQYRYISFDAPDVGDTEAYGINASGMVTGQYTNAMGKYIGFILQNGNFTPLDVAGSAVTYVTASTADGRMPVSYENPNGDGHSTIYKNGVYTPLPDAPGYLGTYINALSDNGKMAGVATNDPTTSTGSGYYYDGTSFTEFDMPGAIFTDPIGINNAGTISGYWNGADGVSHGFIRTGSVLTDYDYPGAVNTLLYGIGNDGVIAGRYRIGDNRHGLLLDNGVATTIDYPGATDTWITYRNDATGALAGFYSDDGNFTVHGYVALPVPEPGLPGLLVGFGLSCLAVRRRLHVGSR